MDVTRIFNSKTRKALFRLFYTNPDSRYYLRELERCLNIPVSMIRKELLSLERAGIFSSSKKGNLSYFFINKSYPLFEEMKSIVFKTIGIRGLLKEALFGIKGIDTAFIYGSFAKNEENAKSDIDLFIIGEVNEDKLVMGIRKLEEALKREINHNLYSKNDFMRKKKEKNPFISEILEGAKIFLVGDSNGL